MPRPKKTRPVLFAAPSAQRSRSRRPVAPEENPTLQLIWNVIAMIPRGRATTYGDVARAAGLVRGARQAAYALKIMGRDMHLPWHRVVGAGGRIVFPKSSAHHREQARRLRSEGIVVKDGRVARAAMTKLEEL